jgi:lamin tail-like protein/Big-like domain-containing protein
MKYRKQSIRVLFFVFLLACLLTGLTGITRVPARAAPQMQAATNVVISEFRTRGSNPGQVASDEFIELYNPTASNIDISNWEIWGSNGNNPPATNLRITISPGTTLSPGQHYLIANSGGYNNPTVPANQTYGTAITDNGGIALTMAGGSPIVDQVGMSNNSAYREGSILTPLSGNSDQSYERKLGGLSDSCQDTGDNFNDFTNITPSRPQNSSSPLSLCGTILPSSTPTATPSATSAVTSTPTVTNTVPAGTTVPSLRVLINEVAWAGTSSSTTDDEWIELYNPGPSPIDISGWKLYGDNNALNTIGDPNITLTGTIPAGAYFLLEARDDLTVRDVSADQIYTSGGLLNTGERLYLKDNLGNIVDTANIDGGAWPAGTASPSYASMERVRGTVDSPTAWVTYGATTHVAHDRNNGPVKGTPGQPNWITTVTFTTITADTPDPSIINGNVNVRVTVIGGTTTPTGTVAITGANTNCTITLAAGTGACNVRFTTIGNKTITAIYSGDGTHPGSSDTELHRVLSAPLPTPTITRTPTPLPPPPLIAINEFVPRPGHDWNGDGIVNVDDEYIELLNHGVVDVNLSGYSLDDEVNIGSPPYALPAVVMKPGERLVFFGSETGLLLSDGGDGVRLLKPNGQLGDAYNYTVVRYPDHTYCRYPDNGGADDWNTNCFPTPGLQNSLSGSFTPPQDQDGVAVEPLCPLSDTQPGDFIWAECQPFGQNIFRPAYWDKTGWFGEMYLPESPGKWRVFAD